MGQTRPGASRTGWRVVSREREGSPSLCGGLPGPERGGDLSLGVRQPLPSERLVVPVWPQRAVEADLEHPAAFHDSGRGLQVADGALQPGLPLCRPAPPRGPLELNWITRRDSENFAGLINYKEEFQPGARRFDVGERSNFLLVPMAVAALRQLLDWGVESTQETLRELTRRAARGAESLGLEVAAEPFRTGHLLGLRRRGGYPADVPTRLAARRWPRCGEPALAGQFVSAAGLRFVAHALECGFLQGQPHEGRGPAMSGHQGSDQRHLIVVIELCPVQRHHRLLPLPQDEGHPPCEKLPGVNPRVGKQPVYLLDSMLAFQPACYRHRLADGVHRKTGRVEDTQSGQ